MEDIEQEVDIVENKKSQLNPALFYLESFGTEQWKFNKNHQSYLLENVYRKSVIDKKHFKLFLKYIINLKGSSKTVSYYYYYLI